MRCGVAAAGTYTQPGCPRSASNPGSPPQFSLILAHCPGVDVPASACPQGSAWGCPPGWGGGTGQAARPCPDQPLWGPHTTFARESQPLPAIFLMQSVAFLNYNLHWAFADFSI